MKTLNISDVRSRLPTIIEEVAATGESVVVSRYGTPLASIVPFRSEQARKTRYPLRGQPITVAGDFDKPTPELWRALRVAEGRDAYSTEKRRARRRRRKVTRS